mgnify:CR=1 FL=1
MKEILAGRNFKNAVEELNLTARETYKESSPSDSYREPYSVWELSDEVVKELVLPFKIRIIHVIDLVRYDFDNMSDSIIADFVSCPCLMENFDEIFKLANNIFV